MTTVLLVDDEPETLAAWEICCERDGFDVKAAGDGQAALAVLTSTAVDIVVADWRMPVMSGSALCHHIRNTPGLTETVFILVSAEPSPPAFVRYDGFMRKPVDVPELLATMRRLLAEHAAECAATRGRALTH
ncbi:response regulator [Paraburkholderia domus]|jgi:Response regulator containing CheY-like receiver, AAA-type ATPase, and DNA-binding domains|uniref:response regulator n=1 Tax=Paraburkholderia domus TaxID=2793075 RepID=UPI0019140832|nr:response regulator [Paraburkholderia domus]MBK5051613.1 response regulator [Burkholderia sp. R-70006]MBK5185182.1 response regulator [Burkholderia sp. R-69749]MCI0151499.1 response regulator [Paraburkholderia sediminicola]CAE6791268.1 Sensory transduction protein regX3 [Paraburkholderia domus]CAE6795286.1 Sensory transduction protein regX3 [Paraburkholderia domus]